MRSMTSILTALLVAAAASLGGAQAPPPEAEVATGEELLSEMRRLHTALAQVQDLLVSAEIPADSEVMAQAAKLVRRVRSMVYATNHELGVGQDRASARQAEIVRRRNMRAVERRRKMRQLRRRGEEKVRVEDIIDVEPIHDAALLEEEGRHLVEDEAVPDMPEDETLRALWENTVTFPECNELLLNDCLALISKGLAELQIEATTVIHHKRNANQSGYNRVVIITDLAGSVVKGRDSDGIVEYPFLWDDAVEGFARPLGLNGQWDCHNTTPEDCCVMIQESCPNMDTKGNYIQCHIFVPFGGVGNKKRDDRVFVNLSPDGRVHEPPILS